MKNIYKHIYYMESYFVRKYDRLWHLEEQYYIAGAILCGIVFCYSLLVEYISIISNHKFYMV